MSKKILSVMLALVMVVSCVAVSAFAGYESEEDAALYTQTWALSEPVDNGDGTWSVDVSLTTNYPTGAIQFVLTNTDKTVAAIKSAKVGAAIPADYAASISVSNATGKVIIVPSTVGVDTITATAINGVIATITYTYSGSGSAKIAIKNDPKTETNAAGSLIAARMDDGDLVTGGLVTGQTVVSVGVEKTIGAASVAPELAVIDGTLGVIDTTRTAIKMDIDENVTEEVTGYIYGIDPYDAYETIDSAFEVIGDGTMEIIANDAGFENGTGAMVNVVDLDGNVVATYVLIIFGDVNGDANVDSLDIGDIDLHENYALNDETGRFDPHFAFAGDVNGDWSADSLDMGDIDLHENYGLNDDTGRLVISDIIAML